MSAWLRVPLKVVDVVSQVAGFFAIILVVGIVVLIVTEIVCRTVLDISLSFAWEYSAYFLGTAIFCGAAFTLRTGGHVRVAFLTSNRRPFIARASEYVSTVFGIAITWFLAYSLVLFAWRAYATDSHSPTIDAVPLEIPTTGLAVGAVLLALQMLGRLIRLLFDETPEDDAAMRSYSVE